MIRKEGLVNCTVTDVYICDCKFPAEANEVNSRRERVQCFYDVVLVLTEDATGDTGTWKGEISNRSGFGNRVDTYRSDLTLESLQSIGFGVTTISELENQFYPNPDGTIGIPNMIGLKAVVTVEKREWKGKEYFDIKYLNSANSVKKLTMEDLLARRTSVAAPAPAPAPVAPVAPVAPAAAPAAAPAMPPKPPCPY